MPSPGKSWCHLTLTTHGSWLPGDPRGFRNRGHRIHSSGHHRAPPPTGEHAALHKYHQAYRATVTIMPPSLREPVARKIVEHFQSLGHQVLCVAVAGQHVHGLVELPDDQAAATHAVNRVKQATALLLREEIQGKLWARGAGYKRIHEQAHHRRTFDYIRRHIREGATVWTFNEGVLEPEA